ncbi:MAG: hypothetical protein ACRCY8_06060 [Dermatophilaceae bacterium]
MTRPRRRARPWSSRGTAGLLVAAFALVAATVLLPWPVASWWAGTSWQGPDDLARAVGDGLVGDWRRGAMLGDGGAGLVEPSQFWQRFHLVKAVLAALLLAVAAVLTARWWSAPRAGSTRRRHAARRLAGVASGGLAGLALLVVVANVQGVIAPLSSVLAFLPTSPEDAALTSAVGALQNDIAAGSPSPVAATLVSDFSTYHAAMAVLGALTAVAMAALVVHVWRRRQWGSGVSLVVASLAFALVAAANIGTALDPAPALDAFLRSVTG